MMIQSANLLSLLSSVENGGTAQQELPANTETTAAFTANLLQELAMLQANLTGNGNASLAERASSASAGQSPLSGGNLLADMQNFAALFRDMPQSVKKADLGINLDDTLNALNNVLQFLQGIQAVAKTEETQAISQKSVDGTDDNQQVSNTDTQLVQAQQPDSLALAIAALPMLPPNILPQQQTVNPADSSIKSTGDSFTAVLLSDRQRLSGLKTLLQKAESDMQSPATMAGNGLQAPTAEGKVSEAALAPAPTVQQPAGQPLFSIAESTVPSIVSAVASAPIVLSAQSKSGDTDKSADNIILSSIAQLDQTVNTEKTVTVPAMTQPMAHPGWNQELGQKLVWMHQQNVPSAELQLNPPDLGPISIKVDVDQQNQATVSFTTQHAEVKDAIESAIPKLRDMLAGQQLNLTDVNVSQQQSDQSPARDFFQMAGEQGRGGKSGRHANPDTASAAQAIQAVEEGATNYAPVSNGLLSIFA